jgi:hypothetical protein
MLIIQEFDPNFIQALAESGLFDILFEMIREHYQGVEELDGECLNAMKAIIANLLKQESFAQISGKESSLSHIIFSEFLELDKEFAVDCLRKILLRKNNPNMELFEMYMNRLFDTKDHTLLYNLEIILEIHEYTDAIAANQRHFSFLLDLLKSESSLNVCQSVLTALGFIFSRSKVVKRRNTKRDLALLEQ